MKLKTFASLSKPLTSAKGKEKQIVINADRRFWNRLTIASKSQDIDFKDVLSYELSSAPLSLSTLDGSLRKPTKLFYYMKSKSKEKRLTISRPNCNNFGFDCISAITY